MVCRNKERGEVALSEIQSATGNKNVFLEVFCLILSSLIFAVLFLKLLMLVCFPVRSVIFLPSAMSSLSPLDFLQTMCLSIFW